MPSLVLRRLSGILAGFARSRGGVASSRGRGAWFVAHAGLLLGAGALPLSWLGDGVRPALAQTSEAPPRAVALEARSEDGNTTTLPIVSESLRVRIEDGHATATYDHVFQNESSAPLEGNYRLMVGEGATATGFSYWNGGERIIGEIFEREAAREIYEAMTGLKRDPGLLEQAGEGGFSFRVFPIAPGERKRVQVATSRFLPMRDGAYEYRVRLGTDRPAITVDVSDARSAFKLVSPTHDLTLDPEKAGEPVHVRAAIAKSARADEELVLRLVPTAPPLSLGVVAHAGEGGADFVTATLRTPPRDPAKKRVPHDITLVLDRSGSMSGPGIEAARAAARKLVAHLDARDAVNVIAFDDKVDALYPHPMPLDDAHRHEIDASLAKLAVRGGTDIALALSRALASQVKDERPDLVLFLTDGQSDGPAAIASAESDKSDTRVFTVGLGAGVDKALLARIASLRKGRFAFVADVRAVEAELPKLIAELEPPVLTDVRVHGEGVTLSQVYPETLPDLFPDDELRLFARSTGAEKGKVVVEGKENGTPRRFEAEVTPLVARPKPFVARGWARARVDDLLEQTKVGGSEEAQKRKDDEIVELGLAYELVTPRTSFLAIPESEMTKFASDAVSSMREKRKKILTAHKDAAALSRLAMPPGDPILRVRAPKSARRVTASFPFGLTLDLAWDEFTEQWATRFLVPKDVADGSYEVPVVIEHADGHVEATSVRYTIDARAPGFTVDVRRGGDGEIALRVTVDEPSLEVRVARLDVSAPALTLTPSGASVFAGGVALPPGRHRLRVVVADAARNESERVVEVSVSGDGEVVQ